MTEDPKQKPTGKKSKGTRCKCGEVVFDLSGKKDKEKLVCPWCERNWVVKVTIDKEAGVKRKKLVRLKSKSSDEAGGRKPEAGEKKKSKKVGEDKKEKKKEKKDKDRKKTKREKDIEEERRTSAVKRASIRTRSNRKSEADEGWTADKVTRYLLISIFPAGLLIFAGSLVADVILGKRSITQKKVFGITLDGRDWKTWVGAAIFFGVLFFGLWMLKVYLIDYRQKKKEAETKDDPDGDKNGQGDGKKRNTAPRKRATGNRKKAETD